MKETKWELRMRLLTALLWLIAVSQMQSPPILAVAGLCALLALVYTSTPAKRVLRRCLILLPFVLISFITLSLSEGIPVKGSAVAFAGLIALRIFISLLIVTLVTADDMQDYLNAFAALRLPDALTSTLFLTERYVHLFVREGIAIKNALLARSFQPRIRMKTFSVYGQLAGGMTVKAFDRSDQVRKAMESRGFTGRVRTGKAQRITAGDVLKTALSTLLLAALVIIERTMHS